MEQLPSPSCVVPPVVPCFLIMFDIIAFSCRQKAEMGKAFVSDGAAGTRRVAARDLHGHQR